ncbi:Carnitine O-acetyltransferase [Armadillidium nasatum]|uniref:Carnitine O-acetyltransferase n=1 Tax=Armadillidium nasatum TaxID=96803 RepID=A0A5N5TJH5_9CRUS|nr:Carnitine O-acetyltransferase [Armadillidium nasatum]
MWILVLEIFIYVFQQQRHLFEKYQNPCSGAMGVITRKMTEGQSSLPRLPVPTLQETLKKYLKSVKPLVTDEEFRITEEIVNKFGAQNGLGEKLQSSLEERAKISENWLTDWWISTAYLDYRWPVVVWSSPGLVFPLQEFHTLDDQLNYASLVIAGALDYKIMVDEKTVPLDMMGKDPLDMSQYFKIFGTCRIPGVTRDSIAFHGQSDNPPTHIVVAHNNHFFKIDVYGKRRLPLNAGQIFSQLRNCVERSTHPGVPVGILTSQNRNAWGKNYKQLCKDKLNKASFEDIQRSIFLVCIDGPINKSSGCRANDAALQCIHGNGISGNAGNRWYDKTIQFIIGKKGEVGLTYEHSPAEGPPIANLMDHIVKYIGGSKQDYQLPAVELSKPKRLMFNIPSDMDYEIENSKSSLESLVQDLEMTCFTFTGFGKNYIKSQKLSPDSFIQMAIQLAFYRIHKEPGAQYESASTRKFLHGRTETIRSCSEESTHFAQKMLDPNANSTQKVMALKSAIEAHKKYALDAVNGRGVDRHLLGLKMIAIEQGMDIPKLFMDVSYLRSSHMRLSTSQVPAECEAFMCYGPLVPDGYGCCYNPRSDSIVFGTSALNSSPETHSTVFRKALEESLYDMRTVLIEDGLKAKL